jgi:Holliday junction DNA helicase RuvA
MIYSLSGKLILKEPGAIVVECGGVGFRCAASVFTVQQLPQLGEQVTVFTHLAVREDAMDLFAFGDQEELLCFKRLISVSGVGPKVALAILSDIPPAKFNLYVVSGDVKAITKANGVGPKLAQRIVLELKDKVELDGASAADLPGGVGVPSSGGAQGEAISALVALGYTQAEAATAVAHLDPALSVEDMIRGALRQMM